MDYNSVVNLTIPLHTVNSKYQKYSYIKPILGDCKYNPYEGLALDQIQETYGGDASRLVYIYACNGIDLTKCGNIKDDRKVVTCIDIRVDKIKLTMADYVDVVISILPNEYTQSKNIMEFFRCSVQLDAIHSDLCFIDDLVYKEILRLGKIDTNSIIFV